MSNEEAIVIMENERPHCGKSITFTEGEKCEAFDKAIAALKAEPCEQFAKWVATEIFDDMWEYNKDAFAEIACRKLAKLGIVRAEGDEWVLVDEEGVSE